MIKTEIYTFLKDCLITIERNKDFYHVYKMHTCIFFKCSVKTNKTHVVVVHKKWTYVGKFQFGNRRIIVKS